MVLWLSADGVAQYLDVPQVEWHFEVLCLLATVDGTMLLCGHRHLLLNLKIVLLSGFAVASKYQEGLILSTDNLEIVLNGNDFHCPRNGGCQCLFVDRLHGQCEGE